MAQAGRGGGGAPGGQGGAGREGSGAGSTGGRDAAMGGRDNSKTGQRGAGSLSSKTGTLGAPDSKRQAPKGPPGSGATHYNEKFDTYVARTPEAQKNLDQAVKDYNDRTFMERVGGFLGFGQVDPTTDPNFNAAKHNAPQTSFDVGGLAASLAGTAIGVPLGTIYDGVKAGYSQITGTNPTYGEVNFGDFGQGTPGYGNLPGVGQVNSQTDPNESAWGGFFGGGGTGAGGDPTNGMGAGTPSHGLPNRQGEGKDPKILIAEALNPQPPGQQPTQPQPYVPPMQVPQSNWQGVPAKVPSIYDGPTSPANYPGMRWIGGGLGSRPLYG